MTGKSDFLLKLNKTVLKVFSRKFQIIVVTTDEYTGISSFCPHSLSCYCTGRITICKILPLMRLRLPKYIAGKIPVGCAHTAGYSQP